MIKFFQSQSTEARRDLILHGSIKNTLIMLSIPTLMMGLVQSMIPLMDGLFLNNVTGRLIASSIHFSEPIINMMTALSQGLGVAAMAIVGQYNGIGDFKNAKKVSTQIVVAGILFGIAMGPTLYIVSILVSMNLQEGVKESVFQYLSLYSFVMPMTFMAAIYNGLKNANGKPEATFIRMLLLLIFKIIFNFIYVYFLQLKIVGSVLASFSTYSLISVWMYYDLFIKESEDKLTLKGFKFDISIIKQLMVIGVPSMLTTFLSNFGFFLINSEVEKYGQIVLNGNGIANNITAVCFNMPAAFGSAVTTMVSMNIGAQYSDKAKKSCYMGIMMSIITSITLIAIILPLSKYMTILFTRDVEDLAIANGALPIYALSIIGFGVTMVSQGALIGLGRTRVPLFISILRIWFFRYIFILTTSHHLQYWSVFYGNLFSNTMAGIITFIIILKTPWRSVINMNTQNIFILRAKLFADRISATLFPKNVGKRKDYNSKMKNKLKNIKDSSKLAKFMKREEEKAQRIKEREERIQKKREERDLEMERYAKQIEEIKENRKKMHDERIKYLEERKKEKEEKKIRDKEKLKERIENRLKLKEERKISREQEILAIKNKNKEKTIKNKNGKKKEKNKRDKNE